MVSVAMYAMLLLPATNAKQPADFGRRGGSPVTYSPIASKIRVGYHHDMPKVKKFDVEDPVPVVEDDDEQTLTAIDEGIRDAEAGRTVPSEEVRKLLPQWISASSTHKER
jgi:predicted transcriptional regulator